MPINKEEFERGRLHGEVEEEIISFLNERKERAFTSQEIMVGIAHHADFLRSAPSTCLQNSLWV